MNSFSKFFFFYGLETKGDIRQQQRNDDNDAWELNRIGAGFGQERKELSLDFDDEETERVPP